MKIARLVTCASILFVVACGGGGSNSTGGGGSGPSGECTDVANDGPTISKVTHPEPVPAMTGGTIADGTYFLTAMDKYNGVQGSETHHEAWRFTGDKVEVAVFTTAKGTEERASGTYTTSGNTITLNVACPMSGTVGPTQYTATATQLVVVNADDPDEVHTYTKQ